MSSSGILQAPVGDLTLQNVEKFPYSYYPINYPLGADWISESGEVWPWLTSMNSEKAKELKYRGLSPTLVLQNIDEAMSFYAAILEQMFAKYSDQDFLNDELGAVWAKQGDQDKAKRWRDEARRRKLFVEQPKQRKVR